MKALYSRAYLDHIAFSDMLVPFERYLPHGEMIYPLGQHIGRPSSPVVKKGDQVIIGQMIAEAGGFTLDK